MTQTVICMKWGTLYGPEYANRLYAMVARNTARPLRFICFTDDATGLRREIEARPLPPIELPERFINQGWRKLAVWGEDLLDLEGPVLFLDLDMLVTGCIDDFFDYEPEEDFIVIHNWTSMPKPIGNTSCFRFRVGCAPRLKAIAEEDCWEMYRRYKNEQVMISHEIGRVVFWPQEWCASFKHTLLPAWPLRLFRPAPLPPQVKLVAFTGKPDIHEVMQGRWPAPWHKKIYKSLRAPQWVAETWRE